MAHTSLPLLLALLTLASRCGGVQIKNLRVPERIVNGSTENVVLDCDYILEDHSAREGLVVKWFFNDEPNPVYQWIHSKRPQDLGILKGRLNLDYRASQDEDKVHRALQILNPTTDLSGDYKCLVSTFNGEDYMSKKMVIFVPPPTEPKMTIVRPSEDKVAVRCVAEGVFPEPKISIHLKTSTGSKTSTQSSREEQGSGELGQVEVVTETKESVYNIIATATYNSKDIPLPAVFNCVLWIPEAKYNVTKSTVYLPDESSSTESASPLHLATLVFACLVSLIISSVNSSL